MPNARLAQTSDLTSLLKLYQFSEVSPSAEPKERAEQIWAETLSHEGVAVFVSCVDAKIVAYALGGSTGFSKMSSLILNFGAKAMDVPWCALRLQRLGPRAVITSSFKVAAQTFGCIASTRAAASSQGFGSATLRAIQTLDSARGPNRRHRRCY
jgi:hypothetical protein